MYVPIFLRQLLCFVVRSRYVTDLALLVLELYVTFADMSSENSANEDANKQEKYSDHGRLCQLLNIATGYLSVQHRESIVFVKVKLNANNLRHCL